MNIIADANVLIRAATNDDPVQAALAHDALRHATSVTLTLAALCEFVWVLDRSYKRSRSSIALSLRELMADPRIICDRMAIEAGLAFLDSAGDFADGVIAFEGQRLGGDVFVTFDRQAAQQLRTAGVAVTLLP